MISITITGQTLEEFKNKLEAVAIEFLTEKENNVVLNSSDIATKKGVEHEKEISKENCIEERKEEVISSEVSTTPQVVETLNEATSIKRKGKKISAKVAPAVYNKEVLKENPKLDLSEMKLPDTQKIYSEDEITQLFRDVIAKGRDLAISVLSKFEVKKFTEIDPIKHQEFAKECEAVLRG